MHGAREERENKCHHESLGYWETRTDGRGIRRKIITSVVFDKSACSKENGSENVQKMKQRRYVPASSAMATQRCVFGRWEKGTVGRSRARVLSHPFPLTRQRPTMSTELPYAADAEDSLSYDELQV